MSEAAIDAAVDALPLGEGSRVLDVGCGAGELLARIKARHGARTEGIEPAPEWAAAARERGADVVHEADFRDVTLELGGYDLVCCLAASHALGPWEDALGGLAALVRPGGLGLVAEGFWRRPPSAGYLERLGGASADELPGGLPELEAGARAAGWEVVDVAVASDADWAAYEETLIANGEAELARTTTPRCASGSRPRGRAGRPGRQGHARLRAAHVAQRAAGVRRSPPA